MWNFHIIGEAVRNINDDTKEKYTDIEWQQIRSFRNTITHEYFGIDPIIVWDIILNYVPKLKEHLEQIKDVDK